jgi:hypothetical protein
MANSEYASGINLDAMMVPVKANTVFAAHEASLYLSGQIVPMVQVPAGSASAQVPVMGSVSATVVTAAGGETDPGADFDTVLPSDTKKTISLDLHAARAVVRDLGGVNTDEISRILGNAIAKSADIEITKQFGELSPQEIAGTPGTNNLDLDEIFTAIATIRGNGETGQLFGIVSTDAYAALMTAIGNQAYAGGDFQTEALRNGFVGTIAGVKTFVSSYLNNTVMSGIVTNPKMAIFSQDAVRGAIQGGVNLEVERRAAAVGFDVVASAAFGCDTIDATRGVIIKDAS